MTKKAMQRREAIGVLGAAGAAAIAYGCGGASASPSSPSTTTATTTGTNAAGVHATGVYASRGTNPTSNASDGIFADSLAAEMVTPTGDPTGGYSVTFQIGIGL